MATPTPMPTANPAPLPAPLALKAPSVCLIGEPGSGKTHSLVTLLEAGIEVFDIVTDPNGLDTLLDQVQFLTGANGSRTPRPDAATLMSRLHWSIVSPAAPGWKALREMGTTVSSMGYEDITKLKQGIGKSHMTVFQTLIEGFANFVDDRTGQAFGDVTSWNDSRALVIDSLSGINKIMKDHTVGYKPSLHQGEWGIAMNLEEQLIYTLAADLQCYFVVLAHLDKVPNEVTGVPSISIAALGNKLGPQLVKLFSEVVNTKREGDKFYWSTSEMNMAVKNRALPIHAKLSPSFAPIVAAHNARKAAISAAT